MPLALLDLGEETRVLADGLVEFEFFDLIEGVPARVVDLALAPTGLRLGDLDFLELELDDGDSRFPEVVLVTVRFA